MLNWLVENGADVALTCDFGTTYLMEAVRSDNAEAVRTLLQAGAQLSTRSKASATDYTLPDTIKLLRDFGGETALADEMTEMFAQLNEMASSGVPSAPTKTILPAADTWINNPVLSDARSAKVAKLLLDAGADPKDLNNAGQRLLMGYAAEPNPALLTNTPEQFFAARERVFGTNNPTKMQKPFWLAMIRAGLDSFRATERFDGPSSFDHTPVWCAQRFGQSITFLNDGRIVQIGGEHEDGYDPDFCIYNDVFVHQSENTTSPIIIYGYPEAIFPPTDFHTATLMGDAIIVIGGLGYHGTRVPSETRGFKLDIKTFAFSQILASGEAPGWIYSHRVDKVSATELRVRGGIIVTGNSGSETHADNTHEFVLNLRSGVWRRHTGCS